MDLEPEALLVVKLIDFGLSRLTADEDGAASVGVSTTVCTIEDSAVRCLRVGGDWCTRLSSVRAYGESCGKLYCRPVDERF